MKYLSTLAIAATLALGGAAAFAADQPAASSSTATANDHSQKACEKAADAQKLTGDARTKSIKECREGKTKTK